MSVRLYAYGGTAFVMRACVGFSPKVAGALNASTWLRSREGAAVGPGTVGAVIIEGTPAIVCRRHCVDREGRPNALTLLFDPGPEAWLRAGWNAVRLSRALFGDGTEPGTLDALLAPKRSGDPDAHPLDKVTTDDLAAAVARTPLPQPSSAAAGPEVTAFADAWMAVLVLMARNGVTSALPQPTRFAAGGSLTAWMPGGLTMLEGMIDALPPCFRLGLGWVSGGLPETAGALGACLVMEPKAAEWADHAPLHHAGRCWPPGEYFAPLHNTPLHLWPQDGLSLTNSLHAAAWLNAGAAGDVSWLEEADALPFLPAALLADIAAVSPPAGQLIPVGQGAPAAHAIPEGKNGAWRAATRLFLRFLGLRPAQPPRVALDPESAVEYLLAQGTPPDPVVPPFGDAFEKRLWQGLAEKAATAQDLQHLLKRARPRLSDEAARHLMELLGRHHPVLRAPLRANWFAFLSDVENHWRLAAGWWFHDEAISRLCQGLPGAAADYLAFCQEDETDPALRGGAGLASRLCEISDDPPHETARRIVDGMLETERDGGEVAGEARHFLRQLEKSSLRLHVPFPVLDRVAVLLPDAWHGLRWLRGLWKGDPGPSCSALDPEELLQLRVDLARLARDQMVGDVPRLADICSILDGGEPWPDRAGTLNLLPRCQRHWSLEQQRRWADELIRAGASSAAREALALAASRRDATDAERRKISNNPTPEWIRELITGKEFERPQLKKLWCELLKYVTPQNRGMLRQMARKAAVMASDWPAFRTGLLALYDVHPEAFHLCVGALPERAMLDVMRAYAATFVPPFRKQAAGVIELLHDGRFDFGSMIRRDPYQAAVLTCLAGDLNSVPGYAPKRIRGDYAMLLVKRAYLTLPRSGGEAPAVNFPESQSSPFLL